VQTHRNVPHSLVWPLFSLDRAPHEFNQLSHRVDHRLPDAYKPSIDQMRTYFDRIRSCNLCYGACGDDAFRPASSQNAPAQLSTLYAAPARYSIRSVGSALLNGRITRTGAAIPINSYCSPWCRVEARNVRGSVSRQVPNRTPVSTLGTTHSACCPESPNLSKYRPMAGTQAPGFAWSNLRDTVPVTDARLPSSETPF
jgi:hypothetical protein